MREQLVRDRVPELFDMPSSSVRVAATLEQSRAQKRSERGGFDRKLVWKIPPDADEPWATSIDEEVW